MRHPPLRERKEDIALLVRYFLGACATGEVPAPRISEAALETLMKYDWPGNVRELENALERAVVVSSGSEVNVAALPERVREAPAARLVVEPHAQNPTMETIEQAYILWVLQSEGGNKSRAAEVLGIDPSTLYRKLNRYGVGE